MIDRGVGALRRLALRDDDGQGLAEYGLLLTLISVVAILIMQSIGLDVVRLLTQAAEELTGAVG